MDYILSVSVQENRSRLNEKNVLVQGKSIYSFYESSMF